MIKVCVFAGARGGQELMPDARLVGAELARRGVEVYYGGSRKGVMGALCDGFKATNQYRNKGRIIGVLPESIAALNHFDTEVANIVTKDMPERKAIFWQCDAFLCLPGGAGTLDELFEIWTETKLGHQRRRPIVVYNQGGYYNHLIALVKEMQWFGTMPAERAGLVKFVNNPIEAVNAIFALMLTQESEDIGGYSNQPQAHDATVPVAGQNPAAAVAETCADGLAAETGACTD